MARKVVCYRKDILDSSTLDEIEKLQEKMRGCLKGSDDKAFDGIYKNFHTVLKKYGGKIYPVTFWSENVEVILVAAILALGIRTFFIQPFQIPTNSMYPTYSGMMPYVYQADEPDPSMLRSAIRNVQLGSDYYSVIAPVSGLVEIPFFNFSEPETAAGLVRFKLVRGRRWFGLLPTDMREYTLFVGQQPVKIRVPLEFSLDEVILKAFFPGHKTYQTVFKELPLQSQKSLIQSRNPILKTNVRLAEGEPVLRFEILSGDSLFVDRFTYHFKKPQVGDPVIFKSWEVPGIQELQGDIKYYIKRMVGASEDTLSVESPILYRNGEPISGVSAFESNASQEGAYPGYEAVQKLAPGKIYSVPEGDHIFVMGDNSPHSWDSRYWGTVPYEALVGRALFIFYPFSDRFGLAE